MESSVEIHVVHSQIKYRGIATSPARGPLEGQPQGPAVPALGLSDSGVRRLARRCRRIQPFENLGIVYEDGTNPISCFANVIL